MELPWKNEQTKPGATLFFTGYGVEENLKFFLLNGVNKDFYFHIDRHPPNLA